MTTKSVISFLEDPSGDIPWDEDETAGDVLHISTQTVCTLEPLYIMCFQSSRGVTLGNVNNARSFM